MFNVKVILPVSNRSAGDSHGRFRDLGMTKGGKETDCHVVLRTPRNDVGEGVKNRPGA